MKSPTKTKETITAYNKKAVRLLSQYEDETGNEWKEDPVKAVRHIAAKRPNWSKSTWRIYRSALLHFMSENGPAEACQVLRKATQGPCKKKGKGTSGMKTKHFKSEDILKVVEHLAPEDAKYDTLLRAWLKAGVLTGMRPAEWESARMESPTMLICRGAKTTNGRGVAKWRKMDMEGATERERRDIQEFISLLQDRLQVMDFTQIYTGCRKRLHDICRQIPEWKRRKRFPTLTSLRHQKIANMKASGVSLEGIAATVGHASDRTATEHYGRKSMGEGGGGAGPAQEYLKNVRNKIRIRPEKQTIS